MSWSYGLPLTCLRRIAVDFTEFKLNLLVAPQPPLLQRSDVQQVSHMLLDDLSMTSSVELFLVRSESGDVNKAAADLRPCVVQSCVKDKH